MDEDNFQELAIKAIESYEKKQMLIDAMFWEKVIDLYEKKLKLLREA